MDKEKLEGVNLQVSAIFARLEALKQSLPEESLKQYVLYVEKKKETLREKYDVNEEQLDEWFQ